LSQAVSDRLIGIAVSAKDDQPVTDPVDRLSDRELEVFQLIGQGKTTGAIARQLDVSIHTIDSYREKLRHKLQVKTGAELAQRAIRWVPENN
jgi:DNA-binding CsgD family transcriptional regulator